MVSLSGVLLAVLVAGEAPSLVVAVPSTKVPQGHGELAGVMGQVIARQVAKATGPGTKIITTEDLNVLLGQERQKQLLGCDESACLAEMLAAVSADEIVSSTATRVSASLTGEQWMVEVKRIDGRTGARRGGGLVPVCGGQSEVLDAAVLAAREAYGEHVVVGTGRCASSAAAVGTVGGGVLVAVGAAGVAYALVTKQAWDRQQTPGVPATVSHADADQAQVAFIGGLVAAGIGACVGALSLGALNATPAAPHLAFVPWPSGGVLSLGGDF